MNGQVPCAEVSISQLGSEDTTYGLSILSSHSFELFQEFAEPPVDQQRLMCQDSGTIEVLIDKYIMGTDISVQNVAAHPRLFVCYRIVLG